MLGQVNTTEAVVKAASGLPGVSVEESAEVLAITRELRISIGQMRVRNVKSPKRV